MTYTIQLAKVGSQQAPGPEVFFMGSFEEWLPLWFTMAIVRGEGRTILINTGIESKVDHLVKSYQRWHPKAVLARLDDERTERILERFGIDPDAVDDVILTPLGFYSCGNISLFRNAKVHVLRSGWASLLAPGHFAPDRPPASAIPARELQYLVTEGWPNVRLLDDDDVVAPGIRTFFSGVHHPSSIGISIDTSAGCVVYTDSAFYLRNVEENVPIGIARSLEEAARSYARIRQEADLVVAAYDPEVFRRYPGGLIGE